MAALKVGVVGCGPIGALHAAAVCSSPVAKLVSVCDLDPDHSEALVRRLGQDVACRRKLSELLEQDGVDVVTVATPDHCHVDVVLAAITAGCHVFCEKPLATTAADCRQLVEAAAERGVFLGVDHNRRFGFGYRMARRLVDGGEIGRVNLVGLHVLDRTPPARVAIFPEVILTTLLTHHLDLARWFGGDVKRVRTRFGEFDGSEPRIRRHVVLSLEFETGALGRIVAGYRDDQSCTVEQACIAGDRGSVHVDDVTKAATFWSTDYVRRTVFEPSPFSDEASFSSTITQHVQRFLECVSVGNPPPVSGIDGLRGLELVEAAIQSHSDNCVVVMPRARSAKDLCLRNHDESIDGGQR
jgi:myo-inositol 2-dehydrogenase/D-chiro-inositol 1-dehydrogenase